MSRTSVMMIRPSASAEASVCPVSWGRCASGGKGPEASTCSWALRCLPLIVELPAAAVMYVNFHAVIQLEAWVIAQTDCPCKGAEVLKHSRKTQLSFARHCSWALKPNANLQCFLTQIDKRFALPFIGIGTGCLFGVSAHCKLHSLADAVGVTMLSRQQ